MAKTEFYRITATSLDDLQNQLNRILNQISDRMDRLEGIRGTSTVQDGLTIESGGHIVHGFNTDDEV